MYPKLMYLKDPGSGPSSTLARIAPLRRYEANAARVDFMAPMMVPEDPAGDAGLCGGFDEIVAVGAKGGRKKIDSARRRSTPPKLIPFVGHNRFHARGYE